MVMPPAEPRMDDAHPQYASKPSEIYACAH
jgi:hypothetical protein